MVNPEVSLYGCGQVCSIVPQQTPTDAHARREEVPQIPLSEDVGPAVELPAVDRRHITPRNIATGVGALKVCTHQDRTRLIRRSGQPALRTPKKQIVTDQPDSPPLLTCYRRRPWGGRGFKTAICSLKEGAH